MHATVPRKDLLFFLSTAIWYLERNGWFLQGVRSNRFMHRYPDNEVPTNTTLGGTRERADTNKSIFQNSGVSRLQEMPQDDSTSQTRFSSSSESSEGRTRTERIGMSKTKWGLYVQEDNHFSFLFPEMVVTRGAFQSNPPGSLLSSRSNASRRLLIAMDVPEPNLRLS